MESMDAQDVAARKTRAAAAAIMADLGFERRENIVTADSKRYREAQGAELERLRASNKKGTAEWKAAQEHKSAINAWSNMWQDVDNPDLEEGEIPEFDGQSHRLRVRLQLHGNEPEAVYGKRATAANQGTSSRKNKVAAIAEIAATNQRGKQYELPKLIGPKGKASLVLSDIKQSKKAQSHPTSQANSKKSPPKENSALMLGPYQVSTPQKGQKAANVNQTGSPKRSKGGGDQFGSPHPRTPYGGNLTSGMDFLATAKSLFQGKPKAEQATKTTQLSEKSAIQNGKAENSKRQTGKGSSPRKETHAKRSPSNSNATTHQHSPPALQHDPVMGSDHPKASLIDYADSSSSPGSVKAEATSTNLADLSGLEIQSCSEQPVDKQIKDEKISAAITDAFAGMSHEQLKERKQKLADGLCGVQVLLNIRPGDSHMQGMAKDIEEELTKIKEAIAALDAPKISLPKPTQRKTVDDIKKLFAPDTKTDAKTSDEKQPVLVLRPSKDQLKVEKRPTLVLRGGTPIQKTKTVRKPSLQQLGITGDLANSIHALVGQHFAQEPEKIPAGPRIGPHNLPNRSRAVEKKAGADEPVSEPMAVEAEKSQHESQGLKPVELVDPTIFLTKSLEKFHLRSPSRSPTRSPPKKSVQPVTSARPKDAPEAQGDQPCPSDPPAELPSATTIPAKASPVTLKQPSSRKSLLVRGCHSLSEIERLFRGLKFVEIRVLGIRRFSINFATNDDAKKGFTRSMVDKAGSSAASPVISWDDTYRSGRDVSDASMQSGGEWLVQGIETLQGVLEIIPPESDGLITTVKTLAPSKHVIRFAELESAISALNRLPPTWLQPPRSLGVEVNRPYISWIAPERPAEIAEVPQDDWMFIETPIEADVKTVPEVKKSETVGVVPASSPLGGKSFWAPGRSSAPVSAKKQNEKVPVKAHEKLNAQAVSFKIPEQKPRQAQTPVESKAAKMPADDDDVMDLDHQVRPSKVLYTESKAMPSGLGWQSTQAVKDSSLQQQAQKKPLLGAKSRWAPPSPERKVASPPKGKDKGNAPVQKPKLDTDPGWNAMFTKYKKPSKHELPAWLQQATREGEQDHGAAVRRQFGME